MIALRPAPFVLLTAFLAGAATLAAELLWIRGVARGLGAAQEAAAAVIGLLLLGLALGALRGSTQAMNRERPTRAAALCLLFAGTWIALSPLYLAQVAGWHASLLGEGAEASGGWAALWPTLLLTTPLVLPAGVALGWSFPLLVRARVLSLRHAARRTGTLYALNTLGAVIGLGGALALLAASGETPALRVAGAAALVGALALLLVDRPLPHGDGPPDETPPDGHGETGRLRIALAASGLAALMAQMAWLRVLQPLAGAHEMGAALLLGPILLAIALGAACAGLLADRLRHPPRLLPWLFLGAGLFTLLSLPLAGGAPLRILRSLGDDGGRIGSVIFAFAITTGPASFFFGALLPAAVRVRASWTGSTAGAAGRLYGWNALGAVIGSVLAGFFLLPALGAERTLLAAAAICLAVGALLRWRIREGRRVVGVGLALIPFAVLFWPGVLSGWIASAPATPEIIAAQNPLPHGVTLDDRDDLALYAYWFAGRAAVRPDVASRQPLAPIDGRLGRVTLVEEPSGVVGLRRGALRESVFEPDDASVPAHTEYALGLLPALLRPKAKRALVIGHGAGWTAEAVLSGCQADVDVAEIDAAVLEAARAWRDLDQLPVERLERARILPRDGRLIMRLAGRRAAAERYDLIASQPSHPWNPSSGHLFSEEAFAEAREALTDEGVMAQWLNLFDMTPDLLRRALATFRSAFPHMWVFRFPGEIVMVGFRGTPAVQTAAWEAFFHKENPRSAAARRAGFRRPGDLWKHLALDAGSVGKVVPDETAPLTDDIPTLELTLAQRRLTRAAPGLAEGLLLAGFPPAMRALLPDDTIRERWLTDATQGWLNDGSFDAALLWSTKLRWGRSPEGQLARARSAQASGNARGAEASLRSAAARWPERGDIAAAWVRAATGSMGEISEVERKQRVARIESLVRTTFPSDGRVLTAAARFLRFAGAVERSGEVFDQALAATEPPPPPGARIQRARLFLSQSHALTDVKRALALLEDDPDTFTEVDSLDMLLRLVGEVGTTRRADELERALATLQRTTGLAHLRAAGGHLAARRFGSALREARNARAVWSEHPAVHEVEALAILSRLAASEAAGSETDLTPLDARESLEAAIERSKNPTAARARGNRILRWFGFPSLEVSESEP